MSDRATHATRHALTAILVLLGTSSCGGSTDAAPSSPKVPTPVLTTMSLSASAVALAVPQTMQLSVTTLDQAGLPIAAPVTWSSSSSAVAAVSSTGLVSSVAAGSATVTATATAGGVSLARTATIAVTAPGVTSVTVAPTTLALVVGGTGLVGATVMADPGVSTAVTWTSSVATTASVAPTGLVTALAAGSTQVCATSAANTAKQACATVTVSTVPVATVVVTPATSTLSTGQTVQLAAATRDAAGNALTGRAVAWTSGSASVATVTPSGLVSAVGAGTVTITATSEGRTASAIITVTAPSITSVSITPASSSVAIGQSVQLSATVTGTNNPPMDVTWASLDATKVTVTQNGLAAGVAATAGTQVCATSTFDTTKSGCGTVIVTGATFPASATISAPNFSFNPAQVDIALGGTVTYSFTAVTHNVIFNATTGAPANVPNTSNANVMRQFNTVGTFAFQCTLHGGMTGTVVVH